MFSSVNRPIGAAVLGIALLGLAACGDGDGGAAVSTVPIQPSSYVVRDAVTTTTAPTVAEPDEEGRSAAEQAYVVQSDQDVPYNIAIKFDVELEELRNFNGWDEDFGGFPARGGTVRIPPDAKFIDPSATDTTDADEEEEGEDEETTPSAGGCTVGTHEIKEGDYPVKVADKYDVTLDALLAANNWSIDSGGTVSAWPGVGGTVTIPAGADCSTTTTTTAA